MKYKLNSFTIIGAIILAAILLFFRIPLSSLLDKIFVKTLFSSFESDTWQDLVFIFLLLLFFVWVAKRQRTKSLERMVVFGLVFYCFQKVNDYWIFKKMHVIPSLYYWDIVMFGGLLSLILCIIFQLCKIKSDDSITQKGFIEDNTIASNEEDHFERKVVAIEIADLIKNTNNKKSFAVGILGQYGSGKTSFLNLINLALEDKKILKISFDPWSATNPEMIRREFFDLLADRIANINPKISSLIYSYGRKLANVDSRSLSWFNWLGFLNNQSSVHSSGEYKQINEMLRETRRKVVITIDDLDRLYPQEIIEVLKLIRNTASFSNVFYLVGYDKEYVQCAIEKLNGSATDYLDKIFQLEIPLPKRDDDDLLVTLKSNLKGMISEEHYAVFENIMIPNGFRSRYEKAYSGILRQGRDVVRFLNNFKIAYKLIGEEVDFECLLLLELIKFRFPLIYDLIYTQSETFLYEKPLRATHEQYFVPRLGKQIDIKNNTDEISVFKTYLEKLNMNEEDISLLDGLFMTLFKGNQYRKPSAKNSISYPLYFEIYFRYRLAQKDLSDKDYQTAKSSGRMREYMQYCANRNLQQALMKRLMQEDVFNDRQEFEQVIIWIFSFGTTFVAKEGMFRFDYQALVDKIYDYSNLITNRFYKKNVDAYREFIDQLLRIANPPFLFENELIFHLKQKGDDFVIPLEELTTHQLSYFTKYAESSHGLNEDALWIFYGARQNFKKVVDSMGAYNKEWRFEPLLAEKMKTYLIHKDPTQLLKFSIQREMYDTSMFSIHKQVIGMFDDPAEYRHLVAENPALDEEISKEYLEFFDKCANVNFSHPVNMEFKTTLQKLDQN